jgi:hypothetical protein
MPKQTCHSEHSEESYNLVVEFSFGRDSSVVEFILSQILRSFLSLRMTKSAVLLQNDKRRSAPSE